MTVKKSNVQKANTAWGDDAPEWVILIADMCDRQSQVKVARSMRYSPAVVNSVINNSYAGSLEAVQQAAEGAFKNLQMECPVLGTIRADRCMSEQRKTLITVSAQRVRLYRACRNGCPNYRGKK